LEVCTRGTSEHEPIIVADGHGREQCVHSANLAASRLGIAPGMRVSAAGAIASRLRICQRDPQLEQETLSTLAAWSGQFTSAVSLAPPNVLLLEAGGSERLFKGLEVFTEVVRHGLADLGFHAQYAFAPTPLGATWLARANPGAHVVDHAALFNALAPLPLACLELDEKRAGLLTAMGLASLVDCLRLPRDGLARRLGPDMVRALDRAFGRLPDPRESFVPPQRFRSRLGLPSPIENSQALLFPMRRLIAELCGFLLARGAGAMRLDFQLRGAKSAHTDLVLSLISPSRDARHLTDLMRERLERLSLATPVEEVRLEVRELRPLEASSTHLFDKHAPGEACERIVERLQARLGRDAVKGIAACDDHRPERAWRYVEAGSIPEAIPMNRRPLWLLPEPIAVQFHNGALYWDDKLKLEPGRERIESGWWDDAEIARDYFVARDEAGCGFWVFRDLRDEGKWYVQGVFG
jgi:protein ImuB